MVISEEAWINAVEWAKKNEGIDVFQIDETGKTIYKNRNKIKCKNKYEQLIYRFKLEKLLPKDLYYLSIHTRTHKTGNQYKTYLFSLKGKRTFKNIKFRTEKADLASAIYAGYRCDKELPDIVGYDLNNNRKESIL